MKKENVDFDVISEDYTICKTENGLLLKEKTAILEIYNFTDGDGKKGVKFGVKDISHVTIIQEIDTTGFEISTPEQISDEDITEKVNFTRIKEPTNLYETKKVIIALTTHINSISLTNKKDKAGIPILRFNASSAVAVLEKPKFDDNMP